MADIGFVEIPGYGKIAYRRQGAGFPLVLMHPVGLDLTFWEYIVPLLPAGFETHALDFRGHGRSDPPPAPFELDDLVSDAVAYLDRMGIGKAVFCGVSMGGMVAQKIALAHPGRTAGLILVNTTPRTDPALMAARAEKVKAGGMAAVLDETLKRWFTEETAAKNPELLERVRKRLLADDPKTHEWAWRAMTKMDVLDRLGEIRCPCLVIGSEHDRSTTPEIAKEMTRRLANAEYAEIANASHMAFLEKPQVFADAARQYLKRHDFAQTGDFN
ncbi:MAG TPA: alpha/beta fold hydrolase [Paenibacillaceae bacterium]